MKSRSKKTARQPSELLRGNGMFWVLLTLIIAALPQLILMSPLLVLACLLPICWRLLAEFRDWKPLPAHFRYLAVGLALLALFLSYGGLFGRRASVSLLTVMLALKLLECHRVRDARLIVSFSFFLCTTQFLFTQGLFMPVYGLVTVLIGLVTFSQLQRVEAFAGHKSIPGAGAPMMAELGFSLRLLLLALPVCIAFFVLFPRWGSPLWGVPETTLDARSGLSDSMSPGSIESLFMDDSTAFRVEFDGPPPGQTELYWRGPVFWRYDGKSWSSSFYGRNIVAPALPPETGSNWRYTVQLEPNERNWLFGLDYPTAAPNDSKITMDFQLLQRQPITQLKQYSLISNPDFIDTPEMQTTIRQIALELPEGMNPRTRELVSEWRSESPQNRALIERVLTHFNEEEFHYSLNAPLLGNDPIDSFMFNTRTGYCEHYASAFAVIMRMAGIPARVVTGYQGGWYNVSADYYIVRQSDAHAWVEVWLEGSGWTRVDPTAAVSPLRVERGSLDAIDEPRHIFDYEWIRGLRNTIDGMEKRWNTWVIDYNHQQQSRLFSRFGMDNLRPAGLVIILFGILGILGLILLPLLLRTRGPQRRDPLQQIWAKFLKRLRQAGYDSNISQGPLELATAAAVRLPEEAAEIHRIADLYSRYRYSARPPRLQEIKEAVRSFRPKHTA